MGFEFLVASGDSLVQIAAANGETRVVIYALRYFWRAGGYAPATRGWVEQNLNNNDLRPVPRTSPTEVLYLGTILT